MNRKEIPVLLLTGYLGSGKTTLLNRILSNRRGIRFAVIVNDIGEVNIDESLIRKGGIVGQDAASPDLVALQNGCICCTLKMDLVEQIADLVATGDFDYIVVEASGVCEPAPIAQTICSIPRMEAKYRRGGVPRLDCIVTVVDALRLQSEFACGDSLKRDNLADEDIERLIIEQIEFCNVILLNKISMVSPEEAGRIRAIVRAIQPKARIIDCDYADVDLDLIVNTGDFDFESVATSAAWVQGVENPVEEEEGHHHHHHDDDDDDDEHHHEEDGHHHDHHHHHHHDGEGETAEYGIETFVYYRRRPFDLQRFDFLVSSRWPKGIIRSKGVVYFSHNTDMSYLFEQAGVQKDLRESGMWYATAPADELEQFLAADPALRRDWDPEYGDRMIKLVVIGQHLDREAITAAFDSCLK